MNFSQDYFELLGVSQQYSVDLALLSENYRQLQKQFHPDNYASKSANEQRLAVQFTSYINNAYYTLKSSVLRAEYLLQLHGVDIDHQTKTVSDGAFLMMQMEWREDLSEINTLQGSNEVESRLDDLRDQVSLQQKELKEQFESLYQNETFDNAVEVVAKMHFVEKMLQEIDALEEF